jgi:hypothetical protein
MINEKTSIKELTEYALSRNVSFVFNKKKQVCGMKKYDYIGRTPLRRGKFQSPLSPP